MTDRMAKLDRLLALVHALSETTEGLTLDEMAERLDDGGLRIRFTTGGMRELAEHLFTWGGELMIEGPDVLVAVMRERIAAAQAMLPTKEKRPLLSHDTTTGAA